ncbi:MAG: BrnA antitoxin family protein [Nitrospirae bacterium]|nr:BrnA antitoxin family protein [Nitrospirota bacterium]
MKKLSLEEKEKFKLKKEYDLSKGIRGRFYHPKKISTTLRIDDDILIIFKKRATEAKTGYQTLINAVLREYAQKLLTKN